MKRLFTIIATHTAALLLGISIALFTAHLNRPRVVLDESALSYSIDVPTVEGTSLPQEAQPLGEILKLDTATQDVTVTPVVVFDSMLNETIPLAYVLDQPDLRDLHAEFQKLKDENRRLKMFIKLQTELKKLKRENQKLRKQTNIQPTPADNNTP